ncbi:MAG: histidinol dehydrogenase, partial [Rectinemataceae bacterium]
MERYSLRRIGLEEIPAPSLRMADPEAEKIAYEAIRALQTGGEAELRNRAEALDGLRPGSPLLIDRRGLEAARARIDGGKRLLLERVAKRISSFARAQRASLADLDIAIQGGRAGHRFLPVARAGCYVPGGRYPLPSSALMTVCAARAAGVAEVWCAGPRPTDLTLAASCI